MLFFAMALFQDIQQLIKSFRPPGPTEGVRDSLFLSLEGIEGSGKSTLLRNLEEHFKQAGRTVFCYREPGATMFGEKLREAILNSPVPLHPLAEAHLFASARAQLLHEKILPNLQRPGSVVILDRYIDSSLAYQGQARGLGVELILGLHSHFPLFLVPHRTFYLDVPIEVSLKRQQKRGGQQDYFEKEKQDFYQKLVQGYDSAARVFPQRIVRIDGTLAPEDILDQVLKALISLTPMVESP